MRLEEVIDFPKEVLKNRNTQFVLCLISHSFFFFIFDITERNPKTQKGEESISNFLGVVMLIVTQPVQGILRMRFKSF